MNTSQRIFFIFAVVFAAVAIIVGCVAAYFGVAAVTTYIGNGGDTLGIAFLFLFLILFALVSFAMSLLSLPLFLLSPIRAKSKPVRRVSRVLLLVLLALFLLNVGFMIFGFIAF